MGVGCLRIIAACTARLVAARPIDISTSARGYADLIVKLTHIYTRTGDDGTANLGDISATSKLDLTARCVRDVNEANSRLEVTIAPAPCPTTSWRC